MGVLKPADDDPTTVHAWMMTQGTILCVDQRFSDWFGRSPNEVVGRPFNTLATEQVRRERGAPVRLHSGAVRSRLSLGRSCNSQRQKILSAFKHFPRLRGLRPTDGAVDVSCTSPFTICACGAQRFANMITSNAC